MHLEPLVEFMLRAAQSEEEGGGGGVGVTLPQLRRIVMGSPSMLGYCADAAAGVLPAKRVALETLAWYVCKDDMLSD